MAIRIKNLDLESDGMRRHSQIYIGDITSAAEISRPCFIAPVACRIDHLDLVATGGLCATTSAILGIRLEHANNSDTLVASVTANTSANDYSVVAGTRLRISATGNNSLSTGQALNFQADVGSGTLSQVMVVVRFTPLLHKETQ